MSDCFYVHIVESPSPADLLNGRTQGRMLSSFLEAAGIPCLYNLAVDKTQFVIAITDRINKGEQLYGLPPILHFCIRGRENGVELTYQKEVGALITWLEVAKHLKPIHKKFGEVGICISSFGGAYGRKMAEIAATENVKFAWVVGTSTELNIQDTALAFTLFYRDFQRDEQEDRLILLIREVTGVKDFAVDFGYLAHPQYLNYKL